MPFLSDATTAYKEGVSGMTILLSVQPSQADYHVLIVLIDAWALL